MPKEQGLFGERAARSTSKNAKDKCNSATLRASQGGAHRESTGKGEVSKHMLYCNSEKDEKDSGYSEAGSDSVHTDVDDQRSSVSEPHQESSKISNNASANAEAPNMTPYEELTPIYVIKNLVVKPSRPEELLHCPMAWGGGWPGLTSGKAPTQLLLIQQTTLPDPSSCTPTPLSCLAPPQGHNKKGGSHSNQTHSSKNLYLPILNSYPRIAPHPRKEIHEGKGTMWFQGSKESGNDGQSRSKRVCTEEEKREAVSTTSHLLMSQQQYQKEGRAHSQYKGFSHCLLPSHASSIQHNSHHCRQSSGLDTVSSPSISSLQTPSPPSSSDSPLSSSSPPSSSSTAHSPYHLPPDKSCTRQRRFLNTAEILKQSGLLAITLRTKELLKHNAATEREINQLRQHTHLLCHIAQSNQNRSHECPDSLSKLLQAMNESGSYPYLDLHHLKLLSSSNIGNKEEKDASPRPMKTHGSPTHVVSLHRIDNGTSPPSPLFAPSPATEETGHPDGPLNATFTSLSVSLPEHGQRPE